MKQFFSSQKGSTPVAAILVLVLAVLGFFGYKAMNKADSSGDLLPVPPTPGNSPAAGTSESGSSSKVYTDGTYTTEGQYEIPNKTQETIIVSLTLKDGVVTDATFKGTPVEQGSIINQKKFTDGFKAEVVGKPIDEVNLTVVNGSSLTPKGFMDALSQIKTQAQIST